MAISMTGFSMPRLVIVLGYAALALAVGACGIGGSAYAPADQKPAATVSMGFVSFEPATVTIRVGDTVRWRNISPITHTVTADPAHAERAGDAVLPSGAQAFDSGDVAAGEVYRHTFTVPGTYRYFCAHHESMGMIATIIVQP